LVRRPEPDGSFARRPSTASLILADERRARQLPRWRLRTARAITASAATLAVVAWTLTAGASYSLVSHFVHMRPVTDVATAHPEVGVLVNAPSDQIPGIASVLAVSGIHASFGVDHPPTASDLSVLSYGDQAVPRLPTGGLVRWMRTRSQLHQMLRAMGFGPHHFLYASNGPSVGQWLVAHGAGGRLIAGKVRLDDASESLGRLHAGEVIELTISDNQDSLPLLEKLRSVVQADHLTAVPVGRLMHDAGSSV
jgi:hypothetical protein